MAAEINRLFLLLAFLLQTGVGAGREFLLEFVDSASRINEFQLARVKRMASIADINSHFAAANRAGFERVAATTDDGGRIVLRVNAFFHGIALINDWDTNGPGWGTGPRSPTG